VPLPSGQAGGIGTPAGGGVWLLHRKTITPPLIAGRPMWM
jgi:hypothetical protein